MPYTVYFLPARRLVSQEARRGGGEVEAGSLAAVAQSVVAKKPDITKENIIGMTKDDAARSGLGIH